MRILFLSDDFPPLSFGGAGISTYELAVAMKKAGHDVFVITTCRKENEAGEFEYEGVKIYRIANDYNERWRAYFSLYNPKVTRQLKKILAELKPDVVHINNVHYYLSYYSIKIAKKYAKAVVFTFRDAMAFSYGKLRTKKYLDNLDARLTWLDQLRQAKKRWNPLRNFVVRRYLRYADKLFAVSDALKIALEQNGIKNVEVMHTGVNVADWQVSQNEITSFKQQNSIESRKVLLFGGRLSEAKGGKQTVEALASLVKKVSGTALVVAADKDKYTSFMMKIAEKLGVGDKIIFTGWLDREKMKHALGATDVVLVPSVCFDALPRAVLEGMAAGRPVVGTFYGGAPEAITDSVTGYVVNPFNTTEMAEKITNLLRDEGGRIRFGEASRKRIETYFNLNDKI